MFELISTLQLQNIPSFELIIALFVINLYIAAYWLKRACDVLFDRTEKILAYQTTDIPLFKTLRNIYGYSTFHVCARTGITVDRLNEIEERPFDVTELEMVKLSEIYKISQDVLILMVIGHAKALVIASNLDRIAAVSCNCVDNTIDVDFEHKQIKYSCATCNVHEVIPFT